MLDPTTIIYKPNINSKITRACHQLAEIFQNKLHLDHI